MRVAVISDEIAPGLDDALRFCSAEGITAVELRDVDGVRVTELDPPALRRVRAALQGGGFECPAVDTAFLKRPPLERVDWGSLTRAIDVAQVLGARLVRVFSGLRGCPVPAPGWLEETLARAVSQAAGSGVDVALEIEHDCAVGTRAEAAGALVDGLGLVWDPGNEARCLGARPDARGHAAVAHAIRHVHVKDTVAAGEWVAPGAGLVDWEGELLRLAAHGYDGDLALETHHALPVGGQEAATRESLRALRAIAARAGVTLT
ncbi:MAG: L-ribulose-5-phosphate 3-epimerase [Gaiellaceae bacterium]|nr:L-ribulose-5-phosphate 3-epimerase [Gaiellaceae bacterium]